MSRLLEYVNSEITSREVGDPIRAAMIEVKREAYLIQTQEIANHEMEEALRQALETVADQSEGDTLSYLRERYVPQVVWASDEEIERLLHAYRDLPNKLKQRQVIARLAPKKVRPADIQRILKRR